ncbi:TolC family protein [Vreelandella titanicae]|uniref:TolC family protein n=1 Tax=Vreelandella titanicae TaxID=664683 RepID=UPI001F1D644C|nr:TolC family protein [Halomonas titanicae]MCE7521258.1 TolC family protein [Halomonas titanicae]
MISIKATPLAVLSIQLLIVFQTTAASATSPQLESSIPSMPLESSVSLNEQTLDLTLSDAVYLGLRQNRTIRSAYLGRISEKFDLHVAGEQFSPKLVLSGRYSNAQSQSDHSQEASVIPGTVWQTEYGTRLSLSWASQLAYSDQAGRRGNDGINFSVTQPLLRGAGKEVAAAPLRLAELGERANILNLQSEVSNVVTKIITTYRDMLQAKEQLDISRQALERSRQLLEFNRELIDTGRMAEFDSVQTEANIANQDLEILQAEDRLQNTRLDLLRLLALDLDTRVNLTTSLAAQKIDISLADALSIARTHQPAYLNETIAQERAKINLQVAENQSLPDISLVGGYSQVRDRFSDDATRRWESYVGVQVDIPIGDPGQKQSAVNAQVALEQQALRITDTQQSLEREVTEAVQNLDTRWQQFQLANRALALSRQALQIEREKLQAGRSSNFQVLSFEADLRNAENARLNAQLAYLNAQTALDQVLGTTLQSWEIQLND